MYTEEIFYGRGKGLHEVTETELQDDIKERQSENPLAYRDNKMAYELTKKDIEIQRKSNKQHRPSKKKSI